ncbi:uncharacterized protein LOC129779031 [Toxorhynchites rutilus septentrionalis]|uniref:uncharacterized protein LOC129779031 n=1 Tax=Toxorhynchites rutilus septentrionalis TaxID=329112 RepID=UPI002479150C|nr:uncharacterized protein LOC129779031 [Toxorhynchites rutilus septentrionalis]
MAKSTAGSKISKRSKKMVDDSVTSSTRARLELELKALEEQQRIQEEDLAEKKKLKDLHRKLEEELREKELAIEVRRIAQAKVALEQKMADESEFRRQQMAIRKHSAEEKVKLIRQASQYGSSHGSRASGGISVTDSRVKVKDWLENTKQQIEGMKIDSTSVVEPTSGLKQVPLEFNSNNNNYQ